MLDDDINYQEYILSQWISYQYNCMVFMIIQCLVYETIVSKTINLLDNSSIPIIIFCKQAESHVKIKISEKLKYSLWIARCLLITRLDIYDSKIAWKLQNYINVARFYKNSRLQFYCKIWNKILDCMCFTSIQICIYNLIHKKFSFYWQRRTKTNKFIELHHEV